MEHNTYSDDIDAQLSQWTPPAVVEWPKDVADDEAAFLNSLHDTITTHWNDARGVSLLFTDLDLLPQADGDGTVPPTPPLGPVVASLTHLLRRLRSIRQRDVMGQLKTIMARFAQRHPAPVAWLSQVREANALRAVIVQESIQRDRNGTRVEDPGIVPRVARTGIPYSTGDVCDDPYFVEIVQGIGSEQAVSIVVDGSGATPSRYVVNQESQQCAQYHPASAELLRQDAEVGLTPLLRELEVLEIAEKVTCCWTPRRYGWGLREFLTTLLQEVKEKAVKRVLSRESNNLHMTVWYVDQEDHVLSPLADTGFTDGVLSREALAFAEAGLLGQLAIARDWEVAAWERSLTTTSPIFYTTVDDMGALSSRLVVTPELSGPRGAARFRMVVQMVSLARESESLLPSDAELRQFAAHIVEQVRGYLCLYPRLAADEIRRAIHEAGSLPDQWHAVAKTMEKILRAGAVTLYVRPLASECLHVAAATAPLKRSDGTKRAPDPEAQAGLTLLSSIHTVCDQESYAGTLASRPGSTLRRNSFRHSGDRMIKERFPLRPSRDYSESLARTESADPRFLGYSLPNQMHGPMSTAVALAVRAVDRPYFKAWDAAALVEMLDAATPMVQSWRDWAEVRLEEAQTIIEETREEVRGLLGTYTLSLDQGIVSGQHRYGAHYLHDTVRSVEYGIFHAVLADRLARGDTIPHRLQDPIPRAGSLAALSREVAVDAYERAWRTLSYDRTPSDYSEAWSRCAQASVLMEARAHGESVMHPVAYFHARRNVPPKAGSGNDPRALRMPGVGDNWARFFDAGLAREHCSQHGTSLRIPFLAWIGQHAARGVLALDMPAIDIPAGADDLRMDLMLLARRLAAAWTVSGSSLPRGQFVSRTTHDQFEERLRLHLQATTLSLNLSDRWLGSESKGSPWDAPLTTFERRDRRGETKLDPSCELWGIKEVVDGGRVGLLVPIMFGNVRVGHIVAEWRDVEQTSYLADPQTKRALWVRDILAAWYLWSWSWTSKGHGNHRDAKVFVDVHEKDGVWETSHHVRGQVSPAPEPETRRTGKQSAQRAFLLLHAKL